MADKELDENINQEPEEINAEENSVESEALEENLDTDVQKTEIEAEVETQEEPEAQEETVAEDPDPQAIAPVNKILEKVREILPKILAVARKCFSIKIAHVLCALGVLIFCLFFFLLLELKQTEREKELIGYIRVNHKVPEWHHDKELPYEAIEHLENYKAQQDKIKEKSKIIKADRREDNPVLGTLNEASLNNEEFFKILRSQDLGKITESSIEKPENLNLSGHNLSHFNYKYFRNFVGADLRYTIFNEISEEGLSFRGSSLAYAQFVDCLIPKTNFIRTHLSYANFYSAALDGSSFIGAMARKAHFKNARMVATDFKESKIIDSDFSDTHLDQANFKSSFLTGSNFNNSKLSKAIFKNAQLQGSSFVNCDLEGADFTNANLEGVDFTGANLLNTKFTNADVAQAMFKNAKNLTLKQLEEVKFLLSARSIPEDIIPKKKSWIERFKAPHDPSLKLRY